MADQHIMDAFDASQRIQTRVHSQDGVEYEITTIRTEDEGSSVYTQITKIDGHDIRDKRITSCLFSER